MSTRHDCTTGGRIILAFGEVTGHCHEVLTDAGLIPAAEFFEVDGVRTLIVLEPCALVHQEHSRIVLDPARQEQIRQGDVLLQPTGPGTWRVIQQREWAGPDQWRPVAD